MTQATLPPERPSPPPGLEQPRESDDYAPGAAKVTAQSVEVETKVPHSWAAPLRDTALETGGQLKEAGALLHEGADALEFDDPIALEAHTVGSQASTLGDEVLRSAQASQVPAGPLRSAMEKLEGRASGLVALARGRVDRGNRRAQAGIDKISDGARRIGTALKTYVKGVREAVDYEKNIDQLGERDSYRLGVDAFFGLAGVGAKAGGEIEVHRRDDKYVVAIDGNAAAGLWAEIGVKLFGVGTSFWSALMAGGGHRLEISVGSADAAKEGVRALMSHFGKKVGRELSTEHAALIRDNLSAVELRGQLALEAFTMMGIESAMSGMVNLEVTGEHVLRAELGDKPQLVFSQRLNSLLHGGVGLSPTLTATGNTSALLQLSQLAGEIEVELENRYELKDRIEPSELLQHPLKALRGLKKQDRVDHDQKVRIFVEGRGGPLGSGGGIGIELGILADHSDLKDSGAIGRALKGDLHGAIQALPETAAVETRLERFADYGVNVSPAVYFMSFGAEIDLEAMRKDVHLDKLHESETPVRELPGTMKRWFKKLLD